MRIGFRSGCVHDPARRDWDGAGPRPVAWRAWYPADDLATETPLPRVAAKEAWFDLGPAARDAPLRAAQEPFGVAVLSHGTGGTAMDLGWLGRRLAARGIVALAPDHHGNTATEPTRAEGAICWWERAADVSCLLDAMTVDGDFAGRLDLARVLAVGFSLGAHTALALVGAVTDMQAYGAWAADGPFSRGPSNFPDLKDRLAALIDNGETVRGSWARQGRDYRDGRVASALLLAPAPPVRGFTPDSLAAIQAPVHIMTGGADREAPVAVGAEWLVQRLRHATLDVMAPEGGHFLFVPPGTERGRGAAPFMFQDAPGIERTAIHDAVADAAERMLAA